MFSRHARKLVVVATVVLACAALLGVRYVAAMRGLVADFFSPYLEGREAVTWRTENASDFSRSKVELIREIQALKKQLDNESFAERRVKALETELTALRELLRLDEQLPYRLVSARVLLRDPATGGRTFVIDRGRRHGLQIGQPVLQNGYLAGRVLDVAATTAHVVAITDPTCRVSVRLMGEGHPGILFGQGSSRWRAKPFCIVRYLPRDVNYRPGMKIETSAYDPLVPAGIPVGELAPDADAPMIENIDNLYKTATLEPYAFRQQEVPFVAVVLGARSAVEPSLEVP